MIEDVERVLARVRAMHEQVRAAVGERLQAVRLSGQREQASAAQGWGAGDRTYALDTLADAPLQQFVRELGAERPVILVAEGPGLLRAAPPHVSGQSPNPQALRFIVDPIDGTRALMHDLRPAWVLTGVAPDHGEATRLSQVELAVQTELPTTGAASYHVLRALRGQGATLARHDVLTGEQLDETPLRVRDGLPLDNGFFSFTRYLPDERPYVTALEQRFLERAVPALGLDGHLLYEDQWLCTAGQLFLLATGRYRLLADLRATLARRHGLSGFAVKPYDVGTLLIFQEAGVPVTDASGAELDAPLDTETALDVLAYGSEAHRVAFEPHLQTALRG